MRRYRLTKKAVRKEIESNRNAAFQTVNESKIRLFSYILISHFAFKVKETEEGIKLLKARLCSYGSQDKYKHSIRIDFANAQFYTINLLLSVAEILKFQIEDVDIKGAYLQSGQIERNIYVRPPFEVNIARGKIWLLRKLLDWIAKVGRQWALTFKNWMLNTYGFARVNSIGQLYVKQKEFGKISVLIATVTGDFLMAGSIDNME